MLPIAPLMIEHRLIERMIAVIRLEVDRVNRVKSADPVFIDNAVDFIRTYADQTHHGKEEDILFRELGRKQLEPEHARIMKELVAEHAVGRENVAALVAAKEAYLAGEKAALGVIIEKLSALADFYPRHIEKEDKHFFVPVMKYFTPQEQEEMLREGQAFDRRMIHRRYLRQVKEQEQSRNLPGTRDEEGWMSFL